MTTSSFKNLPPNFTISSDGSHAVLSVPIEKSDNDERSYRLIRLNNELEALLIHDDKTDKSSAALDVHVGHLCDPDNLQGLAHFCEHLLFMGSEKYPKENEYSEYLSKHNGHSNAYTGTDNTNYYFEVGPEFLEGALDRFAQFFIAPLFDPSCTDREIRAVDSENKKNLQSDIWRCFQLEKSLSNPNHPYSHFGTGNLETLQENPMKQGLDIRDELLKFHDKYYSANIMKLTVLGKESLDQLSQWVIEKFSTVKNKGIPIPTFEGHPLTKNELLKQIFIKPVKDIRNLEITFPFPYQKPLFHVQPGRYLSHLIGHEGAGSILSSLKKKGWANYLAAEPSYGGIGFEFFRVSMDLTESGLEHYEDVVVHVFQYIEMLKQTGVQEWSFREVEKLNEIKFRFKEKSSPSGYTSALSNTMQTPYPREWILSGPFLIRKYEPKLIEESLEWLRPDNFLLGIVSQSFVGLDQKERWYGTEYKVEPISDKLTQSLKNIKLIPELKMTEPNEFIPTNFETHKTDVVTPAKRPNLIKNTQICRLWHKKDDTFWVPKASVNITLKSPLTYTTPLHCVKTRLYVDLVKDALTEYSYNAEIAGLSYDLYCLPEGLLLAVKGYSDKLQILLEKIVIKMKNFEVDPERFLLIKEYLRREYKNFQLESPHQHSMYYLNYLTQDMLWNHEEKLEALHDLKYEDIKIFYPELLNQLHIESLIHGNVLKDDAIKILQKVEEILQPKALVPSQLIGDRVVIIPQGKRFIYQRNVFDPDNINSAIEYYVQVGDLMDKGLRARLSLLAQIANEPCFDQLRTKEQLGYLVFSGLKKQTGSIGLRFIIQSEKDTVHLENRIEAFLNKLQTLIEEMPEEEYQKQVQSLIAKILEKPKNLKQETQKYWNHISSGYYEFDRDDTDVEELRKIIKQDLEEFYKKFISPNSSIFKKLSVHLRSQKDLLTKKILKKSIDVKHLHSCLSSQGFTDITIENLHTFISSQTKTEYELDGPELENLLRTFLIDQSKVDENEIEELVKKVNESYLNNNIDISIKNNIKEQEKSELELELKDGNEMIDDIVLWKSHMELGPAATPVVMFSDLISKL
ncbi:Metalloenzyme, LuxS/M16 peptidase-like protein [Glomus cerebriforme]|uniref:Metalloenzyme, LuxS/M16 peptidase-like protein n=1 Tax=Glomus cerebriforme TaxID=658196 RepID=A0A397TNK0_9GLOM|nr:Metalloenzyme, LuxS/M16 peptidase-like protein [Glomus cerebriforme]